MGYFNTTCHTCMKEFVASKMTPDLVFSPHFCQWNCALRSGRDLTMNGKALASPAYVEGL